MSSAERLLTPVGLRSLAPEDPDYKPRYFGDLRARDAAYHQGTVWAWLIGPFVDAWLKVHPDDRQGARGFLEAFRPHLNEAGWARSVKSSTPNGRSRPGAASPRPGVWPRFSAPGSRPPSPRESTRRPTMIRHTAPDLPELTIVRIARPTE